MTLIADFLLVSGALGAAFYCMILSRRLRRFNDLESGMGNAIAVLSAQVDDMTKALNSARHSAHDSSNSLGALTGRAEGVAQRLELLVASMHDLPTADQPKEPVLDKKHVSNAVPQAEEKSQEPAVFWRRKREAAE